MDADVTIIGAGVIGLAVAAALAAPDRSVVVLDREAGPGRGVTSRNSQVVHAGIYYPAGTLKARLCLEGAPLLYAFCAARGIPCRPVGKLIVAVDAAEAALLEGIAANAREAGAGGLTLLDGVEVRRMEPNLRAVAAIHSARSGIVDAPALVGALAAQAAECGASFAWATELTAATAIGGGFRLLTGAAGGPPEAFTTRLLVNAAGLDADRVAGLLGIDLDRAGYRQRFVKGTYLSLRMRPETAVARLVYPVPDPDHLGLGIHITLGTDGRARLGPDAEVLPAGDADYRVDPEKIGPFAASVRRYLPALREEDLAPEFAGIRPKLARADGYPDFLIREESARGLPGAVNLIGIESPGLTACLAISRHVEGLLAPYF
jgi:L-2-hydroxyglutarate oxidase LhgO